MTDEADPYTLEDAEKGVLDCHIDYAKTLATVRALDAATKRIDELNKHIILADARIRELEGSINKLEAAGE